MTHLSSGCLGSARDDEFAQNDQLRSAGRIDHYGPANYAAGSKGGALSAWRFLDRNPIGNGQRVVSRDDRPQYRHAA